MRLTCSGDDGGGGGGCGGVHGSVILLNCVHRASLTAVVVKVLSARDVPIVGHREQRLHPAEPFE